MLCRVQIPPAPTGEWLPVASSRTQSRWTVSPRPRSRNQMLVRQQPFIFQLPLSLHLGKNGAQLGAFCQLLFKPLEALTQATDFTDDDHARRTHTTAFGLVGD